MPRHATFPKSVLSAWAISASCARTVSRKLDIKRSVRLKVGALIADDARNFLGVHGNLLVLVLKHTTCNNFVHMLELQAVQ